MKGARTGWFPGTCVKEQSSHHPGKKAPLFGDVDAHNVLSITLGGRV